MPRKMLVLKNQDLDLSKYSVNEGKSFYDGHELDRVLDKLTTGPDKKLYFNGAPVYDPTDVNSEIGDILTALDGKEDRLIAGANISITDNQNGTKTIDVVNIDLFEIVTVLPDTGVKGIIYLLKNDGGPPNSYDEYAWIDGHWEIIGTLTADFTNFYTKDEVYTKAEISTAMGILTSSITTLSTNLADNYYTKTEVDEKTGTGVGALEEAINQKFENYFDKTEVNNLFADLDKNLEDNYMLIDGSKAFTGAVEGIVPTADAHLATKGYVDGLINNAETELETTLEEYYTKEDVDAILDSAKTHVQAEFDKIITGLQDKIKELEETTLKEIEDELSDRIEELEKNTIKVNSPIIAELIDIDDMEQGDAPTPS